MTIAIFAFVCWLIAAIPTWAYYVLARRAEANARAMLEEVRRCKPHVSDEAAPGAGYEAAIAMALQEKEGASLQ